MLMLLLLQMPNRVMGACCCTLYRSSSINNSTTAVHRSKYGAARRHYCTTVSTTAVLQYVASAICTHPQTLKQGPGVSSDFSRLCILARFVYGRPLYSSSSLFLHVLRAGLSFALCLFDIENRKIRSCYVSTFVRPVKT